MRLTDRQFFLLFAGWAITVGLVVGMAIGYVLLELGVILF